MDTHIYPERSAAGAAACKSATARSFLRANAGVLDRFGKATPLQSYLLKLLTYTCQANYLYLKDGKSLKYRALISNSAHF